MDLAFDKRQHNVLQYIANNFDQKTDPALLDRTAGFFLEHKQYDKAGINSMCTYLPLSFEFSGRQQNWTKGNKNGSPCLEYLIVLEVWSSLGGGYKIPK